MAPIDHEPVECARNVPPGVHAVAGMKFVIVCGRRIRPVMLEVHALAVKGNRVFRAMPVEPADCASAAHSNLQETNRAKFIAHSASDFLYEVGLDRPHHSESVGWINHFARRIMLREPTFCGELCMRWPPDKP